MHPLNKKLPAFSLIELIVVMVLSGLVVGIIYFSYASVIRYQRRLVETHTAVREVADFRHSLEMDIQQSRSVTQAAYDRVLCHSDDNGPGISYSFSPAWIIREQNARLDTFFIEALNWNFEFQGHAAKKGDLVTRITLDGIALSDTLIFEFRKLYDASLLIQYTKRDSIR